MGDTGIQAGSASLRGGALFAGLPSGVVDASEVESFGWGAVLAFGCERRLEE